MTRHVVVHVVVHVAGHVAGHVAQPSDAWSPFCGLGAPGDTGFACPRSRELSSRARCVPPAISFLW